MFNGGRNVAQLTSGGVFFREKSLQRKRDCFSNVNYLTPFSLPKLTLMEKKNKKQSIINV